MPGGLFILLANHVEIKNGNKGRNQSPTSHHIINKVWQIKSLGVSVSKLIRSNMGKERATQQSQEARDKRSTRKQQSRPAHACPLSGNHSLHFSGHLLRQI